MAKSDTSKNLKLLREMLNTEVNTSMFNPDIRDRTPKNIMIIIENEDGHIHCIKPDDEVFKRMISKIAAVAGLHFLPEHMLKYFSENPLI